MSWDNKYSAVDCGQNVDIDFQHEDVHAEISGRGNRRCAAEDTSQLSGIITKRLWRLIQSKRSCIVVHSFWEFPVHGSLFLLPLMTTKLLTLPARGWRRDQGMIIPLGTFLMSSKNHPWGQISWKSLASFPKCHCGMGDQNLAHGFWAASKNPNYNRHEEELIRKWKILVEIAI